MEKESAAPKVRCLFDKMVPVESLKTHPKNRNAHSEEQIKRLSDIIQFQGWRYPIKVSNISGCITSGHGRLLAALKKGWLSVPVNYQDYDSPEQEYADVQADNAIASWAELDLSGINTDVADLGPDFNIDMLGIKDFELVIGDTLEPQCDEDEIPENVEPRTKLGDIYQLGRHRLMCGDSTNIDAVEELMNGVKADMVFTDPPYGMFLNTDYDQMFSADDTHRKTGKRFDAVKGDNEDFAPELINTVFAAFSYCREIFLWGSDYYSELIPDRKDGSWIVWDKRCGEQMDKVTGNTFELCWSKQKHKRLIARIIWSGHHGMQGGDTKTRIHPTQKPSKLIEWFFDNWGGKCSIVVDLFGGSGSTLIACEKTNRNCYMMELDPHYCDVITARWEKYTGKKAILLNQEESNGAA
jgi:DNA modification methylase